MESNPSPFNIILIVIPKTDIASVLVPCFFECKLDIK